MNKSIFMYYDNAPITQNKYRFRKICLYVLLALSLVLPVIIIGVFSGVLIYFINPSGVISTNLICVAIFLFNMFAGMLWGVFGSIIFVETVSKIHYYYDLKEVREIEKRQ